VGFDNIWHADGTSPYTQAVDILVEDFGRTWVSAAGNENERYRIGALSNKADDLVAIDGMSPVWVASSAGKAVVSLRWSEPMGESGIDLDLALYDEDGNPCGGQGQGVNFQDGDDDPYEIVECHTGGSWAQAYVLANGNNVTGLEGYLYAYGGLDEADATGERNLTLPGDTRAGISVGAVDLPDTGTVASYSSRGPTDYGEIRPHLVAPAGVSTSSYGAGQFSGTSAATPHVTGVAALVLHADRLSVEPSAVRDFLTGAAIDIGPAGQDHSSGAGFLVLEEVPWRGCHCAQGSAHPMRTSWAWLLAGCCGVFLRRRFSS
jgi:subtilisin family serine protease